MTRRDLRVCEVESEFSDGSFITTSNAEAAAAVSMPAQIRSTKLPAATPIAAIVARHDESKREWLGERGSTVASIAVQSMEECTAQQDRQQAIKAAFRKGIGYLDPAEIRRIAEQRNPDAPAAAADAMLKRLPDAPLEARDEIAATMKARFDPAEKGMRRAA